MKIGKKVWLRRGKKVVEAVLVEFGKGSVATIKFADGRQAEVSKLELLAKRPA